MSKCAVHMMKMKMSAMGGIQSHNQREHESKKNKEIDYEKSKDNFDTVLDRDINYQRTVKARIEELNLKKAVRKDAVTYCSFIVSSDRGFFERLAQRHLDKVGAEYEGWRLEDYKVALPEKYDALMKEGCREFFERATEFFKDRYGAENVINGTVHLDEATPHMHLGVVPVTSDGRLSAKEIFTPLELKQLQTDFAEIVGEQFNLERGKEGSEATHLDELSFKVQKRQEELQKLENDVFTLQREKLSLTRDCEALEKRSETLKFEVSDLEERKYTLDSEITRLEGIVARFKAEFDRIGKWLEENALNFKKTVGNLTERMQRHMESVKYTDGTSVYDSFKSKELTLAERMEEARRESKNFGRTIEEFEADINRGRGSAYNSFGSRTEERTRSTDDFELE